MSMMHPNYIASSICQQWTRRTHRPTIAIFVDHQKKEWDCDSTMTDRQENSIDETKIGGWTIDARLNKRVCFKGGSIMMYIWTNTPEREGTADSGWIPAGSHQILLSGIILLLWREEPRVLKLKEDVFQSISIPSV